VTYTRPADWTVSTTYALAIGARDAYNNLMAESYTFATAAASPEALAITTTTLPNGTVGTPYSQPLAATGGVSPYSWDNTAPLPSGLSISPSGTITGTPITAGGPTTVTFRVTDSASPPVTDTQNIDITINAGSGYPTVEIGTVADTWLQTGNSQNFSTGDENWLYTWPTNTAANITVMKWDLSSVSGTVPTSATMRIYVTGYLGGGGDNTYAATVHRFTGVNPTISSASWMTYNGTTAWTGGADGGVSDVGASEATILMTKTPQYYNVDVTAMVREWLLNESSNKGMMIKPPETATVESNRHIASVEHSVAAYRPVLTLTYVPEPSPNQSLTGCIFTGGIIQ
jgi:hypothetical protein